MFNRNVVSDTVYFQNIRNSPHLSSMNLNRGRISKTKYTHPNSNYDCLNGYVSLFLSIPTMSHFKNFYFIEILFKFFVLSPESYLSKAIGKV